MAKRKAPTVGPKDTSKLKGGLKAYWDKKNAEAAKKGKADAPATETKETKTTAKTKTATKKPPTKKPTAKKKPAGKIGVRKTTVTRLTGSKKNAKAKADTKPKREGGSNPLVVKQLLKTRGTGK